MFQALQNVYKKDARYRKLVIGQRVAMLGLVAGMGLSIIAIGYGIHTMKLEKVNRYNEIVKQQTEYRKSGEYEKEEAQYQKAINLLPAKEESYYQNACALYEQKEYQDCIDIIDVRMYIFRESCIVHDCDFNRNSLFFGVQIDHIVNQVLT